MYTYKYKQIQTQTQTKTVKAVVFIAAVIHILGGANKGNIIVLPIIIKTPIDDRLGSK